ARGREQWRSGAARTARGAFAGWIARRGPAADRAAGRARGRPAGERSGASTVAGVLPLKGGKTALCPSQDPLIPSGSSIAPRKNTDEAVVSALTSIPHSSRFRTRVLSGALSHLNLPPDGTPHRSRRLRSVFES